MTTQKKILKLLKAREREIFEELWLIEKLLAIENLN